MIKRIRGLIAKFLRKATVFVVRKRGGDVVWFYPESRRRWRHVKSNMDMSQSLNPMESYHVYECVRNTLKLDGEIAEVGVFAGDSAKTICLVKGSVPLHLFDTFEGHPEVSEVDTQFKKGDSSAHEIFAKRKLAEYQNVFFYRGLFPDTAEYVGDTQFSFVHLDVDIYRSTLVCLEFFYPRMCVGGIILIHDYPTAIGVLKAIDEFFANKPEPVINVTPNQALIVKTGGRINE